MLTDESKRKINSALTVNNGNRKAAAAQLDISTQSLKTIIHNNSELKKLWAKKQGSPLEAAQAKQKSVVAEVIAENEEQTLARREKEFQKLMDGTTSPEELEQSMSLLSVYSRYTEEAESMIGGSLISQAQQLDKICKSLGKKLSELIANGKQGDEFVAISQSHEAHLKMLASIMGTVTTSRLAKAKIKSLKEAAKGNKRRGTPGFAPKKTNVIAQNVQINNK